MNRVHALPDYYRILGVSPSADPQQVKRGWRRAAKIHHPDRFQDAADKAKAEARFKRVNEAYQVLSDPARRRAYDQAHVHMHGMNRRRYTAPIRPVVVRVRVDVPPFFVWLLDWIFGSLEPELAPRSAAPRRRASP